LSIRAGYATQIP